MTYEDPHRMAKLEAELTSQPRPCAFCKSERSRCVSYEASLGCIEQVAKRTNEDVRSVIGQIEHMTNSARQRLLEGAMSAVLKDRNRDYGPPEDSFNDIRYLWNAYLHGKVTPLNAVDVAMMMILLKVARLKMNPNHWDSKMDIAGYAACSAEMRVSETKMEVQSAQVSKGPVAGSPQ